MCVNLSQEGHERILGDVARLEQQLQDLRKRDRSATSSGSIVLVSSSVPLDPADDEQRFASSRLRDFQLILSNFRIAPIPQSEEKLRIHHQTVISVRSLYMRQRPKQEIWKIGGYLDGDVGANPRVISYDTPWIVPFLGKSVGDKIRFIRNDEEYEGQIRKIMLSAEMKKRRQRELRS